MNKSVVIFALLILIVLQSSCTITSPITGGTSDTSITQTSTDTSSQATNTSNEIEIIQIAPKDYSVFKPSDIIVLTWTSSPTESATYTVYLAKNAEKLQVAKVTDKTSFLVPVEPESASYKWQISTKDSNGNEAKSKVLHFLVKCKGW